MELNQLIRNLKKLNCDVDKLYSLISSNSNNSITSINSIDVDNNGKLILTFTDNTGINTVESDSLQKFIIKYNVLNYTELLTKLPNTYDYAYVRQEQGNQWLPGSLGGNYYSSGLYMWDGIKWIKDDISLINEINNIINTLNTWEQTQW